MTTCEDRYLLELVTALREFAAVPGNPLLWGQIGGADGRIRLACEAAVRCGLDTDPESDLRRCWRLMQKETFQRNIGMYPGFGLADADRLARHARAMIATAGAASALRLQNAERFVGWWCDAVPLLEGTVSDQRQLVWEWTDCNPNDPHSLLDSAAEFLGQAGWSIAGAHDWTRHWLVRAGFPRPTEPLRTMTVPVLAHVLNQSFLNELRLELMGARPGPAYEAIQGALLPLGGDLIGSVAVACARVRGTVRWSFLPDQGAPGVQSGRSLEAAAHVAAVLLDSGRHYDRRCVITGMLQAGDRLQEVSDEEDKFREAARRGYRRGGVAAGVGAKFKTKPLEVVELETLTDAVDFASGLITNLREYLTRLTQAEKAGAPAYLGGRSPIHLYVEPDVLKRTPRPKESENEDATPEEERPKREEISPEGRDIDEDGIYGEDADEIEERVGWASELEAMGAGKARCAVILGPPGQGKTELWRMTSRRMALQALQELAAERVSLDTVTLPVKITLRKMAECGAAAGEPAEAALRRVFGEAIGGDVGRYVAEHLAETRVWLFLDALDEVPAERRGQLAEFFDVLRGWQCRVVMTSRPYAFSQWSLPFLEGEVAAYRLAPHNDLQAQKLVKAWYSAESKGQILRNLLVRSTAVRRMAQSPYLMTLLCWVGERRHIDPEIRRTGLYEHTLTDLLGLTREGGVEEGRGADLLPMMCEIGLSLFAGEAGKKPIGRKRLLQLIEASQRKPMVRGLTAEQSVRLGEREKATYLLKELEEKRFLTLWGPDEFLVPHRSVLEYLAGAGAAEKLRGRANGEDWWTWVDAKAWDPDWKEVIVFAAGSLVGSWGALKRLLNGLRDETRDDHFRHRLALAAECLGEMPANDRSAIEPEIDGITTEAFELWWERNQDHTVEAYPVRNSLSALAMCNGKLRGMLLLDRIAELLIDQDGDVRDCAIGALDSMGAAAATPVILNSIAEMLADPYNILAMVAAVKKMGTAAITPGFLDQIAEMLANPDRDGHVRRSAANVVLEMGEAAMFPSFLDRLATLLKHPNANVRESTADLIGELGTAANPPFILDRLVALLADPDNGVSWRAAGTLARFGEAVATPMLLDRIAELLADSSWSMRCSAAGMVRELGAVAATPVIVGQIATLLSDPDRRVRSSAAMAVSAMGAVAATPLVLDQLAALLADPDTDVLWTVVDAVERIGEAAATPMFLDRIVLLSKDPDPNIRYCAARVAGGLGAAAAAPQLMDWITALLDDPDPNVRSIAMRAALEMGKTVDISPVIDRVIAQLADPDRDFSSSGLSGIGGMQDAVDLPVFLDRIATLLGHPSRVVRLRATEVVLRMGAAAATPAILDQLGIRLADRYPIRCLAANVVGRMGPIAATPVILGQISIMLADTYAVESGLAAEAVGGMGEAAATPVILDQITALLADPDRGKRLSAIDAVGQMGAAAARPAIFERVGALLSDHDFKVRRSAERAMRGFGAAVVHRISPEQIAELLVDYEQNARSLAEAALSKRGTDAATPALLDRLFAQLADRNPQVYQAPERGARALVSLMDHGWLRLFGSRSKQANWKVVGLAELTDAPVPANLLGFENSFQ